LITADLTMYEAAVTVVGEAATALRMRCSTVTELKDVDAVEILGLCASAPAMAALGLGPDTAFDAARAVRWRELAADDATPSPDWTSGDTL
jgi:hypothetical protein